MQKPQIFKILSLHVKNYIVSKLYIIFRKYKILSKSSKKKKLEFFFNCNTYNGLKTLHFFKTFKDFFTVTYLFFFLKKVSLPRPLKFL